MLQFIVFYLTADVRSWLAQAYCSFALVPHLQGGVVSVLLGVSLHHRAVSFSPFPLPSWVSAHRCLLFSVSGARSVLRHSTSPFLLHLPDSSFRILSFCPGVS